MKVLGLYLWKEWREFRSIAIGILVAVPLLLGTAAFVIPAKSFADPDSGAGFALLGAVGALAIMLFALTTDLFAGEVRRGRIAFLDRLPFGLRAPFLAKALVFLIGTAGAFLYGFEIAALLTEWRSGAGVSLYEFLYHHRYFPVQGYFLRPVVLFGALVVWGVLPVACMTPRGVLTLPLAALLWGGLVAAFVGLAIYSGFPPTYVSEMFAGIGLKLWLAAAAIGIAAYFSFVRGYRAGGGWPRAMRWGLLVIGVAYLVPLYPVARASVVTKGWVEGHPRISHAYLSGDGNFVYLQRYTLVGKQNGVLLHARRVDLRTGEYTELDAKAISSAAGGWLGQQPGRHPYLMLDNRLIDSVTGREPTDDLPTVLRDARRAATPFRTPDGRRLWLRGGKVVVDGVDGGVDVLETEEPVRGHSLDFGVHNFRPGVYDVPRLRYFPLRAYKPRPVQIRVRPGRWIVRRKFNAGPWLLFDPETAEYSEAQGLGDEDRIASVHDDGRLFVVRRGGALVLLDPESGQSQPVRDDAGIAIKVVNGFGDAGRFGGCAVRTPGGARIFMLDGVPARYDAESSRLVRARILALVRLMLIGCISEDEVLVQVGEWGIQRIRFGAPSPHALVYRESRE